MAAKPENTFIGAVHGYVPADIYRMKTNNPYVAGIPDCYYSGSGGELWVEYKFIAIPKRPETLTLNDVSKLQELWLRGRHAEGRNVVVIVGSKEGGVIFQIDEAWSIPAKEFRSKLLSRREIAMWITHRTRKR